MWSKRNIYFKVFINIIRRDIETIFELLKSLKNVLLDKCYNESKMNEIHTNYNI